MKLSGGCLCGRIRFSAEVASARGIHCHCGMCRRASGAAFSTWVGVDAEALRWDREGPRSFASSSRAERGFCDRCGSSLTMRYLDTPQIIDVSLGALDHPEHVEVTRHIWTSAALPRSLTGEGLPRHREGPGSRSDES